MKCSYHEKAVHEIIMLEGEVGDDVPPDLNLVGRAGNNLVGVEAVVPE